jgi:hypothetical protein
MGKLLCGEAIIWYHVLKLLDGAKEEGKIDNYHEG